MGSDITRREALRRAALLLGGTLSAPTILGVLAGCRADTRAVWVPRTLTPHQHDTLEAIAEIIIPTTDTPGARDAGVGRFVDAMFSQYYAPADRLRFLDGLDRVDAQAKKLHGRPFTELSTEQQTAMVSAMDRAAFSELPGTAGRPFRPELLLPVEARKSDVAAGEGVGASPAEAAMPTPSSDDIGSKSFFRMMKELTVVGYYTSEVGQTRELRLTPWGRYRDIPYKPGTPAWA
jgi:glucoside 3-dehydrogenase (cytochrome c) hitch-hiker subunit